VTTPTNPEPSNAPWRLALAILAVLIGMLVYRVTIETSGTMRAASPAEPATAVVHFTITRPDAPPVDLVAPWSEGQTVADATRLAAETRWRGEGAMALLEEIDGVPNQGPDGLNWQFEVNGRYATKGAGAVRMAPGDRVLWKLAPYE
jgi:hypothetical protein